MKTGNRSRSTTLLGLLTAILLVMGMTPLGYLNIGPLAISLNMIPVAIGAAAMGPVGGAVLGAVFGMTSFLQSMGIGGISSMGAITFAISPVLTFVHRFVTRVVVGFLVGWIYKGMRKISSSAFAGSVAGLSAAILNTVLFMGTLILLFGQEQAIHDMMKGQNVIEFVITLAGVNAVVEMIASTLVTGALCAALERARLMRR